jgi:hypothetical protein
MDAELMMLVSTAATTVVGALATDAWEQAKRAVGALWGRVHPERAETVEAELAEVRSGVLAAREAGDERAELDLVAEWQGRLGRLLTAEPGLAEELRTVIDDLNRALPEAERTAISRIQMHATASGNAQVNQAGRDQHIRHG